MLFRYFVGYFSPRFRKWCCGALKCHCNCNGKVKENSFDVHCIQRVGWGQMRKMWLSMLLFLCSIRQKQHSMSCVQWQCAVFSVRCPCIGNMVQVLNMYGVCTCLWAFFFDFKGKMHIVNSLFVMNCDLCSRTHSSIFIQFALQFETMHIVMLKSLK